MAVYINTLNGGSITIGTGSSVLDPTKTRFTLQDGTVETYDISGTLDQQWMIDNGYRNEWGEWVKTITQAEIGNTVTSIGGEYSPFNSCYALTSVTIPDSVTFIGSLAFEWCSGLASVTIPDTVTTIEGSAFENCFGITSVTIIANGGNAANVKQAMIDAGVPSNITWNMPS